MAKRNSTNRQTKKSKTSSKRSTVVEEKVDPQELYRKKLDSIDKLYDKLSVKLGELEAKIEASPTLSQLPNKPR